MYQTMSYEEQLNMKAAQVKKLIDEAVIRGGQVDIEGKPDYIFEGIKGSPQEFAYRNKMEFSFGDEYKDGPLSLGLHKKGSTYDVLNACDCKLVHEDMTKILTCILEYCREEGFSYYHKMQHTGFLPPFTFTQRKYNRGNFGKFGNYKRNRNRFCRAAKTIISIAAGRKNCRFPAHYQQFSF